MAPHRTGKRGKSGGSAKGSRSALADFARAKVGQTFLFPEEPGLPPEPSYVKTSAWGYAREQPSRDGKRREHRVGRLDAKVELGAMLLPTEIAAIQRTVVRLPYGDDVSEATAEHEVATNDRDRAAAEAKLRRLGMVRC